MCTRQEEEERQPAFSLASSDSQPSFWIRVAFKAVSLVFVVVVIVPQGRLRKKMHQATCATPKLPTPASHHASSFLHKVKGPSLSHTQPFILIIHTHSSLLLNKRTRGLSTTLKTPHSVWLHFLLLKTRSQCMVVVAFLKATRVTVIYTSSKKRRPLPLTQLLSKAKNVCP